MPTLIPLKTAHRSHARPSTLTILLGGISLATCANLALAAENDSIVTDRPDFVESSQVVGKGHFQIETSVSRETNRTKNTTTNEKTTLISTPTLLRFGISEHWEARIETDGRIWLKNEQNGVQQTSSGWADTSLGLKWALQEGDEKTGKVGIGLLLHADLASGSRDLRGQGVRPSVRLVAEWEFANEVSLGLMPGIVLDKNAAGQRFNSALFGAVLGKGLNDNWRVFVELAASQIASSRNGGNVVTLDLGSAYLINKHTQIDAVITRGLNKNTPDWNIGTGLSIKF